MAALLLLAVQPADAQTSPSGPAAYLSGGVLVSMQPDGNSDCPYLCGPLGGTAWGVTIGGGARVREHLTAGAELSVGGTLTASQALRVSGGDFQSDAEHRDTILSGVLRFSRGAADDPIALALIGGGGLAWRRTRRIGEIVRDVIGGLERTPHREELNDVVPAAVGGIDVPIRAGARAAIVPFARVHYLFDRDRPTTGTDVKRGVSPFIFRAGATVSVLF